MRKVKMKRDWDQLRGKVREKWERLTEVDVQHIDGECERLICRIKYRYCVSRDWAEWQVETWNPGFDITEVRAHAPTYLAND